MSHSVFLEWKEFSVPVDKLNQRLKNILLANYDGMVCESEGFYVVFKEEPSQDELDTLNTYWNGVTELQFSPSLKEIIRAKINEASAFGRATILDFATENVEMGITQANKTREVADYLRAVQRYLESGSLYAALAQVDEMISLGVPSELSPFVTVERLTIYRDKIQEFLEPGS